MENGQAPVLHSPFSILHSPFSTSGLSAGIKLYAVPSPTPIPLPLPVAIEHPALPQLWQFPGVVGPGAATRDIFLATPPGYGLGTSRHPVVYLQDGQNLFDPALSFAGHWGLLETLASSDPATAPIIVGVPNLGRGRLREYSPFDDVIHGDGEAGAYLTFLRSVVKPMIDTSFRTRPEREWTTIGGSSMGGLLSLYALIAAAGTFGSAWVMSPAFWYGDGAIFDWLAHQPGPVGRVWLDVGLDEGPDEVEDVRRMRDLLIARGWRLGDTLRYHEDPPGDHDEATWGRRIRQHWPSLMALSGATVRRSRSRKPQ